MRERRRGELLSCVWIPRKLCPLVAGVDCLVDDDSRRVETLPSPMFIGDYSIYTPLPTHYTQSPLMKNHQNSLLKLRRKKKKMLLRFILEITNGFSFWEMYHRS